MSSTTINMTCPRCGSADIAPAAGSELALVWFTDRPDLSAAEIDGSRWHCLRDDQLFTARPCKCGSYYFQGSEGTSGALYVEPLNGSECWNCGHVTLSSPFD